MLGLQKHVGRRIRAIREEKGLSQEALAAACDLHRTYIGLIERGERSLSISTIEIIAKTLGVKPSWLFEGVESPPALVRTKSARKTSPDPDLSAHIATIRQLLIDARVVDAEQYDRLFKAQKKLQTP